MVQDITDEGDLVLQIGSSQAGGSTGVLIIDDFEMSVDKGKETKHGVGNTKPKGRLVGNQQLEISFTHIGQNSTLIGDIQSGNFNVVFQGDEYQYEIDDVDGNFTVNISDGGEYELDFDGDALDWERTALGSEDSE